MIDNYNVNFGNANALHINLADMTFLGGNGANKPATGVSWNQAARFVNWLNTSTGSFAAYKFTTGGVNDNIVAWTESDTDDYDPLNLFRSRRAKFVLPNLNEWYKAAYYDPSNNTYYTFPTGSNLTPISVASGTIANTAVYGQSVTANVDEAGGLSPYGVMGLGGNVAEFLESNFYQDFDVTENRAIRGGHIFSNDFQLSSSFQHLISSSRTGVQNYGFRVASLSSSAPPAVPEPSMMVIGTLFGIGGLMAERRMKK